MIDTNDLSYSISALKQLNYKMEIPITTMRMLIKIFIILFLMSINFSFAYGPYKWDLPDYPRIRSNYGYDREALWEDYNQTFFLNYPYNFDHNYGIFAANVKFEGGRKIIKDTIFIRQGNVLDKGLYKRSIIIYDQEFLSKDGVVYIEFFNSLMEVIGRFEVCKMPEQLHFDKASGKYFYSESNQNKMFSKEFSDIVHDVMFYNLSIFEN